MPGPENFFFNGAVTLTGNRTLLTMDPTQVVVVNGVTGEGIFGSLNLNKSGRGLLGKFDGTFRAETSDLMPGTQFLGQFGDLPGLGRLLGRLGVEEESPGVAAAALLGHGR